MYEPSRLIGNPENLTGLLLITAQDPSSIIYYYTIASHEQEKLLSLVRNSPGGLEEAVRESMNRTREVARIYVEHANINPDIVVYSHYGFSETNILPISRHDDLDEYPVARLIQHPSEFVQTSQEIISGYFLDYTLQQKKRSEKGSKFELTIYDVPHKEVLSRLLKLSVNLMRAIRTGPFAQIKAEDLLHRFTSRDDSTSGLDLTYELSQIIKYAASTRPDRGDIVALRCRIIGLLMGEDDQFPLAVDLENYVERLTSMNILSE
jgi:hypothetical protein